MPHPAGANGRAGELGPRRGSMETKRPRSPSPTAMATSPRPPSPPPSPSGAPLAFTGSSEQDVALAKSFWNSVTLQPPLESRLGARRGSVCNGAPGSRKGSAGTATAGRTNPFSGASSANGKTEEDRHLETEKNGWKGQCLEKAKKREEIIALLKKQREERILKETLSCPHKPKRKTQQSSRKEKEEPSDLEDEESVKALP
ncbi:cilia- and flagella-associated protein HOATZ [Liasis olivaceus]